MRDRSSRKRHAGAGRHPTEGGHHVGGIKGDRLALAADSNGQLTQAPQQEGFGFRAGFLKQADETGYNQSTTALINGLGQSRPAMFQFEF